MRERNLYLEKCRHIEDLGENKNWGLEEEDYDVEDEEFIDQKYGGNPDYRLLQAIYEILYTEK